jgi:MFS transporter, FSR family, fosmidomycin resistance protein
LSNPAPPSPYGLRAFGPAYLMSVGHGASHWITGTFFLLLPKIREEFGFSYAEISLIGTIYYIGSLSSNVIGGPAVDMTGRRILFQVISLFASGLALVGLGLSGNFVVIAAMGVFIAAANNLWHPAAMSFLSSEYPKNRAFMLSLHGVGSNVGEAVGPIAAGALLTWSMLGWQSAAYLNAAPALLTAVVFIVFLLAKDRPVDGGERRGVDFRTYMNSVLAMIRDKAVVGLSIMAGFRSMAQSGLKLYLPFYIVDVLGLPYAYAGIGMTALLLGGMVASPIAGAYSDRIGRRAIISIALAASTVVIVALTFVGNATAYVIGISLLGFSMFAIRPVIQGWMMDLVPRRMAGSAISLMFSVQAFKAAITPLIGGVIADRYGLPAVFYFLGAVLLLANVVVFLLPKEETRAEAAE